MFDLIHDWYKESELMTELPKKDQVTSYSNIKELIEGTLSALISNETDFRYKDVLNSIIKTSDVLNCMCQLNDFHDEIGIDASLVDAYINKVLKPYMETYIGGWTRRTELMSYMVISQFIIRKGYCAKRRSNVSVDFCFSLLYPICKKYNYNQEEFLNEECYKIISQATTLFLEFNLISHSDATQFIEYSIKAHKNNFFMYNPNPLVTLIFSTLAMPVDDTRLYDKIKSILDFNIGKYYPFLTQGRRFEVIKSIRADVGKVAVCELSPCIKKYQNEMHNFAFWQDTAPLEFKEQFGEGPFKAKSKSANNSIEIYIPGHGNKIFGSAYLVKKDIKFGP